MPTEKPIVWIGRKARFTVTQRTTEHGGKTYPRMEYEEVTPNVDVTGV